jgi:hypothetical protein
MTQNADRHDTVAALGHMAAQSNASADDDALLLPDDDHVNASHGQVEEVCAGYQPTRDELFLLARDWAQTRLDIALNSFFYWLSGSIEFRRSSYAAVRLSRLAEVLGEEEVRRAEEEVEAEARRKIGAAHWRIFTEGTPEEKRRVADEVQETSDYLDGKRQDRATQAKALDYLRDHPTGFYLDEAGDLWSLTEWATWATPRAGEPGERLHLRVTTARGVPAVVTVDAVERRDDRFAPFGLGG